MAGAAEPSMVTPSTPAGLTEGVKKGKNLMPFFIGGGVILFLGLAISGIIFGLSLVNKPTLDVKKEPGPVTEENPVVPLVPTTSRSRFASDAGVLKLRDGLKELSVDLDTVNFFEPEITPPDIDLNLKI